MKTISVKSFAKINVCLDVVGKRSDGYHDLDMVMIPIHLHDSILISELKHAPDNMFSMDDFSTGFLDYNIVVKVLDEFEKKYQFGRHFNISIHKVIPMQAGLGGGSSNAAVTLNAVNKYVGVNASEEELIELTKSLGADIPFFIKCKAARCQGIGEKLTEINVKNQYYVLLVKPQEGCPTRTVYNLADSMTLKTGNVDEVVKALEEGNDEALETLIFNGLEGPAVTLVPEIPVIEEKLRNAGLKIVQMSGSGSSVFALSTNKKLIKKVAKDLEKENKYTVIVTKTIK